MRWPYWPAMKKALEAKYSFTKLLAHQANYLLTSPYLHHHAYITKLNAYSPRHQDNRPCKCVSQGKIFSTYLYFVSLFFKPPNVTDQCNRPLT
ncbi:hypothetical protein TIFTF001_034220 [Ficus carica]|uniref:Uncharacterized protein n=1 Tax=Ficus carica TaxID=3494 RepID=A0AA88DZI2_FICCA|nr:hypothetical protein TIFTF001_034220 [Ficus carica]